MQDKFNAIEKMMTVPTFGLKAYAHYQIKNAAQKAVELLGHDWAMKTRVDLESLQTRQIRGHLKKIVWKSAEGWHPNKYEVWKRFRQYAIKQGSTIESQLLTNRLKLNLTASS